MRCHECGDVIRLPAVTESEMQSGKPIPVFAERAEDSQESNVLGDEVEPIEIHVETRKISNEKNELIERGKGIKAGPISNFSTAEKRDMPDSTGSENTMGKPVSDEPEVYNLTPSSAPTESVDSPEESDSADDASNSSDEIDFDFSSLTDERSELDEDVPVVIGSDERVTIHDDRKFLVRFFAVCISLLGIGMSVPAGWYWWDMVNSDIVAPLPRWVFLLIFISGLHVVYSVFLFQLPDWSSLWAVSIVMVVLTAVYGFIAAGVWLDEGGGPIVQFLQVPTSFLRNATIWTLVMLCLSGLSAYVFGREAIAWKHASNA